jgi:putative flippase GtrA
MTQVNKREIWLNQEPSIFIINKKTFNKLFFYGLVGLLGTAIHFSTLVLLVEIFGLGPTFSSSIGFILTVIISFFLNKNYTFKVPGESSSTMLFKYILVSWSGFILNSLIMYLTVQVMSVNYMIGQAVVIVVLPITNFLLNNYWTFKE